MTPGEAAAQTVYIHSLKERKEEKGRRYGAVNLMQRSTIFKWKTFRRDLHTKVSSAGVLTNDGASPTPAMAELSPTGWITCSGTSARFTKRTELQQLKH